MIITRDQFDEKIKEGGLKIAFVGMSNVGKSLRAREFAQQCHFQKVSVDDEIKEKLGFEDMLAMASWMGFPYEEKFKKHEEIYLNCEEEYTKNCLKGIADNENFVLDTTGSVIYLKKSVLDFLQENFLILNLQVSEGMIELMTKKFFKEPKPVVWGDSFNQKKGESNKEALQRNYPDLLVWRQKQYKALADVVLDIYTESSDKKLSFEDFLEIIREELPTE
ncbi:hypothetical protein KAI58_04630 [Candidatus Gracilibacteria bacterium]|nr:hypothetical protein [Candidatus Gracilibacteria bacterium]